MPCSVNRGTACLPVTALHIIEQGSTALLLSNEGSGLVVRNPHSLTIHCRTSIFHSQNIHGITSHLSEQNDDFAVYFLVVWGGRLLRVCSLQVERLIDANQEPSIAIRHLAIRSVSDWIMTVTCDQAQAYILTARNTIWTFQLAECETEHLHLVSQGTRTLLNSGAITPTGTGCLLIASGTIFGEVFVWICRRVTSHWIAFPKQTFLGHQGSIFGVEFSKSFSFSGMARRLLASCSDDRTIRIWEVTESDAATCSEVTHNHRDWSTGFSIAHEQRSQMAMVWAHLSRIWGIHFLDSDSLNASELFLLSRGEDGVCQTWKLDLGALFSRSSQKDAFQPLSHDHLHSGKNIWSLASISQSQTTRIYSGGADGQIVCRHSPTASVAVKQTISFVDIGEIAEMPNNTLRQCVASSSGGLIAVTGKGNVIGSHIGNLAHWHTIVNASGKGFTRLCRTIAGELGVFSLADGTLNIYDIATSTCLGSLLSMKSQVAPSQVVNVEHHCDNDATIYLIVMFHGTLQAQFLTISLNNVVSATSQSIHLPPDFQIASSFYHCWRKTLVCGSRLGALAVFPISDNNTRDFTNPLIIRHLHASDSITAILELPNASMHDAPSALYLLTTGRDGSFAAHCLGYSQCGNVVLETLHRALPPFGPNIEGAYITSLGESEQFLLLYGFKSKDFVVWNETHQTQHMRIDCGGAHRSWSYSACRDGGVLTWTRAGALHVMQQSYNTRDIIQPGGHGREIKALAISNCLGSVQSDSTSSTAQLLATGSEDTDIRLFAYRHHTFKHVGLLRGHTTGLQALQFSECGHYLFSCGGMEEFMVWRLNRVPVIGIGAIVVGTLFRTEEDNDARIMSAHIISQDPDKSAARSFLVLMAYSNGKAKLFEFQHLLDNNVGRFTLLQQLNIGSLCLSQAGIMAGGSPRSMLIGATDGCLRFAHVDVTSNVIEAHRVHQSNIAAMSIQEIEPWTHMIATGGDDNALALSLLDTRDCRPLFRTCLVPKAHAAAVTAVALIRAGYPQDRSSWLIVTAGNDQRVKVWHFNQLHEGGISEQQWKTYNEKWHEASRLRCTRVCDHPTGVADVSSIEIVDHKHKGKGNFKLSILVGGVGMQVLNFDVELRE